MVTPPPRPPAVTSEIEAVRLTNAVLDALEALEPLILEETALLAKGETEPRLRLPRQTEAAGTYLQAIEAVKTNSIAMQRFRPDAVQLIRERHEGFAAILSKITCRCSQPRARFEEASSAKCRAPSPMPRPQRLWSAADLALHQGPAPARRSTRGVEGYLRARFKSSRTDLKC